MRGRWGALPSPLSLLEGGGDRPGSALRFFRGIFLSPQRLTSRGDYRACGEEGVLFEPCLGAQLEVAGSGRAFTAPPTPHFFSNLQSVLFAFFKPHLDLRMLDLRR